MAVLLYWLRNKHIKGEITSRYYNIMRPFNHKLALYAIFAQRYLLALGVADDVGKSYEKSLNKEAEDIVKLACKVAEQVRIYLILKQRHWIRYVMT